MSEDKLVRLPMPFFRLSDGYSTEDLLRAGIRTFCKASERDEAIRRNEEIAKELKARNDQA